MIQPRSKIKFVITMHRVCERKCWEIKAKRRKNYDPELECLECLLSEHIEGYPARDFGESIGELQIERCEINGVDENRKGLSGN